MSRLVVVPLIAIVVGIASCGDDDDDSSAAATTEASGAAATTETSVAVDVPDVVGETVDDATATLEAAGLTLRVVRRDGEDLAATMDFVDTRVNVAVETQDDGTEVVTEVVSVG